MQFATYDQRPKSLTCCTSFCQLPMSINQCWRRMQIPALLLSGQPGLPHGDMDNGIFETPARVQKLEHARPRSQFGNETPPPAAMRGRELTVETALALLT